MSVLMSSVNSRFNALTLSCDIAFALVFEGCVVNDASLKSPAVMLPSYVRMTVIVPSICPRVIEIPELVGGGPPPARLRCDHRPIFARYATTWLTLNGEPLNPAWYVCNETKILLPVTGTPSRAV